MSTPTAKVTDGRLVLNLPDAETPALWVMDLADAQTSVIRIEADKGGLYVLKKHGGKGAAETIAVYRDREAASRAMDVAAKALSTDIAAMAKKDGGTHTVDTVGGCKLALKADNGKVTITDENGNVANVTIADVMQSNGVIHVIDKVLLPKM